MKSLPELQQEHPEIIADIYQEGYAKADWDNKCLPGLSTHQLEQAVRVPVPGVYECKCGRL